MSFSLKVRAARPHVVAALAVGEFLKMTAEQSAHDRDRRLVADALGRLANELPSHHEDGRVIEVEAYGSTLRERTGDFDGASVLRSFDVTIKVRSVPAA